MVSAAPFLFRRPPVPAAPTSPADSTEDMVSFLLRLLIKDFCEESANSLFYRLVIELQQAGLLLPVKRYVQAAEFINAMMKPLPTTEYHLDKFWRQKRQLHDAAHIAWVHACNPGQLIVRTYLPALEELQPVMCSANRFD